MASVQFTDVQTHPTEFRSCTSSLRIIPPA